MPFFGSGVFIEFLEPPAAPAYDALAPMPTESRMQLWTQDLGSLVTLPWLEGRYVDDIHLYPDEQKFPIGSLPQAPDPRPFVPRFEAQGYRQAIPNI